VAIPLLSKHGDNVVPAGLLKQVFARVAPPSRRSVTTTAPEWVETGLRKKGSAYVLHLVNLAPGKREFNTVGRRQLVKITDIPPAPPCHVSVQLPARPRAVRLEPQGVALEAWRYETGRLEIDLPSFAIHQMVVMPIGP
jgi:hypothetical protein